MFAIYGHEMRYNIMVFQILQSVCPIEHNLTLSHRSSLLIFYYVKKVKIKYDLDVFIKYIFTPRPFPMSGVTEPEG